MFRLVSENLGFAYVRQIIIINHGYLVNIDKLFYYILSLGNKLVMKFWRNRRCPKKKSSFKSYFGEFTGTQSRTIFYTPLKTCCPRENGSVRRGAACTSQYTRGDLVFLLVVTIIIMVITLLLL